MENKTLSCIVTVIKDEQEYLDEWIRYHLNIGVDHIFVFEDIDSKPHVNNYDDLVSITSISDILNENDLSIATNLKKTKKRNPQHIYFKSALNYIKQLQVYSWCFIIDADEFITMDSNLTLDKIFCLYQDYDAFIMQWKCYGANGYIRKPIYTKDKGVIDIYTEEMKGTVPDIPSSFIKTCYNISNYKEQFFYNQHHPKEYCNWCNTEFEKNWDIPRYSNIYIRHYITKSWEEYIWKKTKRGFPWGGKRNINFFYSINPEMKETLVILPYVQKGSQGNEITLALNSWRKFCTFNYHFVVIGEFDQKLEEKFPWVEFITCPTKIKIQGQYNPHLDIQHKIEIVMNKFKDMYTGFIWMVDDNYAIKPFTLDDIITIHYHSSSFNGNEKQPTSYWNHDKWKTRQLLNRENLPHINYTTHFPCYFEFSKLKEIWDKFNMLEESYVLEDVYFNYFHYQNIILDKTIRLGIWNQEIYNREFQKAIENPDIKFVCNSTEGWSKNLEFDLKKVIDYKTILITGGLGFIGSHLNSELHDYNIINVDFKNGIDVKDESIMEEIFKNNSIDTVIHLAAIPGVGYSVEHPDEVMENNINGFDTVAKLAIKYNVPHMVYASSSSIYGDGDMKPKSPYALSKKINEEQAEDYSKIGNTKFTGLRFFTVYGEGIRNDLAICKFIHAIENNDYIFIHGDGEQSRDFTYVEDICKATKAIVESDKQWRHEIFDVGCGNSITVNNLISMLKDLIDPSFDKILYDDEKSYDAKHTLADPKRLYEWFGFKPTTDIRTGLKTMIGK